MSVDPEGARDAGTADPRGAVRRPEVRRVDRRLGLAVCRLPLSGRSLVNYTRDHVAVRTPSRPEEPAANSLDLSEAPEPSDVERWVARYDETVGRLGARHRQLRWELPAAPGDDSMPGPRPALAGALARHGLSPVHSRVLLLDGLATAPPVDARLVPVEPPATGSRATDRRWHAATVLYRYATGNGPQDWRDWEQDRVAWSVEVQRELAVAGRAQVWLALRHGAPVARLTLLHDRQGLAGVHDLVVHPAHRRLGLASALVHAAVAHHLGAHPDDRVGVEVTPASPADRLARRLGFVDHAVVVTARG